MGTIPPIASCRLLGPFTLSRDGAEVVLPRKAQALFALLSLQEGAPLTREIVVDMLWTASGPEQARLNLRQCLWSIRHRAGCNLVQAERQLLRLAENVAVDARDLRSLAGSQARPDMRRCADLYRGELLAGLDSISPRFDEWLTVERQRLRELAAAALRRSAEAQAAAGEFDVAVTAARHLVALDDLNEDAHRLLMRILGQAGRRAEALRQFELCKQTLRKELNIDPDAETGILAQSLREGSRVGSALLPPQQPVPVPSVPVPQPVERRQVTVMSCKLDGLARLASEAEPEESGTQIAAILSPLATLRVPEEPSIAVLPFRNLGPGSASDYFSDGIVEDIVVSLGGLPDLFVISRGSTLAFRGKALGPREVGHILGVRYIVGGSIRRSGKRLRVSCELCDAESGRNIWSDRMQVVLGDIFDLQDELVEHFVSHIAPHIRETELRRALRKRPDTLTAYDYTLQALDLLYPIEQKNFWQARVLLANAIEKEPKFAMPHAWLARWHNHRVGLGWSSAPASDSHEALRFASRAIELDRRNGLALAVCGHIKSFLFHDYDSALYDFDRALTVSPSGSLGWALSSATLSYLGLSTEAIRRAERALRLSPVDHGLFYYHSVLSLAHYSAGKYQEAVTWGRIAIGENPNYTSNLRYLAAAFAASNKQAEARKLTEVLKTLDPTLTLSSYGIARNPFRDPHQRNLHLEHLRQAGLQD